MEELKDERQDEVLFKIAEKDAFDAENICIRSIASELDLTERECEISVSALLSHSYLSDIDGFIGPKDQLSISDAGLERLDQIRLAQQKEPEPVTMNEAMPTHVWHRMGSHADGAGQITKDKWYPMGSICNSCGLMSRKFKINPTICPKYNK